MPKSSIRRTMLTRRDALLPAEVAALSETIAARLTGLDAFMSAEIVALYWSVRSEVATAGIFAATKRAGKRVVYPRMHGDTLEFVAVEDLATMKEGRYGIYEPACGPIVPLSSVDLVVMPGVAFDRRGIRLGYGKGCYDRVFAEAPWPTLVGLAYDFQLEEALPAEGHDIPVDIIVTEKETLHL